MHLGFDLRSLTARAVLVGDDGAITARAEAPRAPGVLARLAGELRPDGGLPPRAGLAAQDPAAAGLGEEVATLGRAHSALRIATLDTGAAAVLAEAWCGAARGVRHLACLVLDEEVSAGLLFDGALWRGAHGLAGSAAWMALNPVERLDYRRSGCLHAEVSDQGIARRLVWRIEAGDRSRVLERAGGRIEAITAGDVFAGARGGDGVAISVVRDTAKYVGMAVANLVSILDPEAVVVGGTVAEARDLLLEPVRLEATRRLSPPLAERVRIEMSILQPDAAAIGAARFAAGA